VPRSGPGSALSRDSNSSAIRNTRWLAWIVANCSIRDDSVSLMTVSGHWCRAIAYVQDKHEGPRRKAGTPRRSVCLFPTVPDGRSQRLAPIYPFGDVQTTLSTPQSGLP
jgi:hypothetical protein